ncbi:MAG: hypothetical protein ABIT71_06495 [Vicinamibacteraceae bacterium]
MLALALVALAVARPAFAQAVAPPAGEPPRARIALDETLDAPIALLGEPRAADAVPVAARIVVSHGALGDEAVLERLDARATALLARDVAVWLVIESAPPAADAIEAWGASIAAVSNRFGTRVGWLELRFTTPGDPRLVAFALKRAAVDLHAVSANGRLLVGGPPAGDPVWLERVYAEDVASYVDGIAVPVASSRAGAGAHAGAAAIAATRDPGGTIAMTGVEISEGTQLVDAEVVRIGSPTTLASYHGADEALRLGLRSVAHVGDLIGPDVVRLEPAAASLTLSPAIPLATLVYDTTRFGTALIYAGTPEQIAQPNAALDVTITLRAAGTPSVRDPYTGTRRPPISTRRDPATNRTVVRVPIRQAPLVLDFGDGLADAVTERSDVTGRSELSVGEIVARHQQARAADDRALERHVVLARMEQHFRPTTTDPGFDVVTENRFFADRAGVEWEELSFSVNGTKWGADRPAFPLLQPEKVLSPPLDLRLDADYRYRLDGTETIDGAACYVVRFTPSAASTVKSLYRGTVWIDRETFRRRKLQAVQTGLAAPVVSNDETVRFTRAGEAGGRQIFLPIETVTRQIVLVAGRNILVEKTTRFSDYQLNPADFDARRLEARRSERVMYRDTDKGMRYYVKEGETRVVSDKATTSAKAMAIGTTIDPSFAFPLPILGINYLDFEFGSPDSQLALLFGGVLVLGNIQRPKLLGPIDGSVDFFAIAVPGSDSVYDAGGQRDAERVLTWPLSAGGNLGWQYTSYQKLLANYQFAFNAYLKDRTTAEDFVVPRTTITHGIGLGYEYRRGGYSVVTNGTWYGRQAWDAWGPAGAVTETPRTYTKYSASVTKEIFLSLLTKARINAAYFGGRDLDRFSTYQFGLFDDTKIHGVPAAGVRYDELAMVRGSYSFNAFEQYRFDAFVDRGWGRLRGTGGTDWEGITGIGAAFNMRAPWNTIMRGEIGKSFLASRYRENGSVVAQILFLKPLKSKAK